MIKCFEVIPKKEMFEKRNEFSEAWRLMDGEGELKFTRNKTYVAKIGNKDSKVIIINDKGGVCKIHNSSLFRDPKIIQLTLRDFFDVNKTFYVKNNKEYNDRRLLTELCKIDHEVKKVILERRRMSIFSPTFDLFEVDITDDTELLVGDLIRYKNGSRVRQIVGIKNGNYLTEDYTDCYGHCKLLTINDLKTQFKLQRFVKLEDIEITKIPIPGELINPNVNKNYDKPIFVVHDRTNTIFKYLYCVEEAGYGCISDKVHVVLPDDAHMSLHAQTFKDNFSMILNYEIVQY